MCGGLCASASDGGTREVNKRGLHVVDVAGVCVPATLPCAACQSLEHSDDFWREKATELLQWDAPFTSVQGGSFHVGDVNWFAGGKLNVSVNCIDRHLATRAHQVREHTWLAMADRWFCISAAVAVVHDAVTVAAVHCAPIVI